MAGTVSVTPLASRSNAIFTKKYRDNRMEIIMKREHRWTLGIALISISLAAIAGFAKAYAVGGLEVPADATDPTVFALLVGFATATFSFAVRSWNRTVDLESKSNDIKNTIEQQAVVTAFAHKISRHHDIIMKAGLDTMMSQMASLVGTDHGFIISGTDWAMRSNTNFWREVKKYRCGMTDNSLRVLVVHSGGPDMWTTDDALASLKAQKNLSSERPKEKIKRIIVGEYESDELEEFLRAPDTYKQSRLVEGANEETKRRVEDIEKYLNLMAQMDLHDIETYYAQGGDDDFGSDFALLILGHGEDKRRIVMKWVHSAKRRGRVVECHFIDWADESYENKWYALEGRAKSYAAMRALPQINKGGQQRGEGVGDSQPEVQSAA